jgi:hypothetical protein
VIGRTHSPKILARTTARIGRIGMVCIEVFLFESE